MLAFWKILHPTFKVKINGIEAELPYGAEETSDIAVTTKAVSKTSRAYCFDDYIMKLSTMTDWFDNRSKVSLYFILEKDAALKIGGFEMQALDGTVGIVLTSTYDSAIIHVASGENSVGRLRVTTTTNYKIRYREGDSNIAGYIEYKGPILPPEIANTCYHKFARRILPF